MTSSESKRENCHESLTSDRRTTDRNSIRDSVFRKTGYQRLHVWHSIPCWYSSRLHRWQVEVQKSNIDDVDYMNRSSLHYAAEIGDESILTYLLSRNARIVTSTTGNTPLHVVSDNACLSMIDERVRRLSLLRRIELHDTLPCGSSDWQSIICDCRRQNMVNSERVRFWLNKATVRWRNRINPDWLQRISLVIVGSLR